MKINQQGREIIVFSDTVSKDGDISVAVGHYFINYILLESLESQQ